MGQPRICNLIKMKQPAQNEGYLYASGTGAPASTANKYQTGCIYNRTDGGAETAIYVNEGTFASPSWVPLLTTSNEIADLPDIGTLTYGAGKVLVADGDSYEEVAISGDATLASNGALTVSMGSSVTPGTVTASKVVVVDASKNIATFGTIGAGTITAANDDTTDGVVDALVLGHSSSDNNATVADGVGISMKLENATGTSTYEEWASIDTVSTTITDGSEDGDIVVKTMLAGTVTESLRIDASDQSLTIGRNATDANGINQIRVFPLTASKGSLLIQATANSGDTVCTITNAAHGQGTAITIPDSGLATSYLVQSTAALTVAEADVLDDATMGDAVASKVLGVDANKATRIGAFATGGAATGAVAFAAGLDKYTDGQLDILSVFGASASDLTSAYSAKCARFRHVVTTASGSVAQETYGAIGQCVVKDTTITHLNAGLMGTFEGHTSGVVCNSSYTIGQACVIARLGGHAAITATKPIAGFLAFNNGAAALASGTSCAFATSMASASYPWTVGLYVPAGSASEAIRIGDFASTAGGSGVALSSTNTNAANFYGDDGAVALTASHTKVLRGRMLVSTAISGGPAVTTNGVYGQVKVAADCTVEGYVSGMYGYCEAAGAITLTNTTCCFSGVHARVDVPSGATIAASSFVAGVSIFGDLGGTHTGQATAIHVRAADAGDWDTLMEIPAEVVGGANGAGADTYIDITIAGVAARITAKYVS